MHNTKMKTNICPRCDAKLFAKYRHPNSTLICRADGCGWDEEGLMNISVGDNNKFNNVTLDCCCFSPKSKKGWEWVAFAKRVCDHIESYTLTQYGDSDGAINLTPDQIISNIERYLQRYGRGARGIEEQRRDFLKVAHYACLLAQKFEEENHE